MTKVPAKKPSAKSKDLPPAPFREIQTWNCCKGQKLLISSPALGWGPEPMGYHKAKVLNVDLSTGSIFVFVATDKIKGHYLIPIDTAAAKVK